METKAKLYHIYRQEGPGAVEATLMAELHGTLGEAMQTALNRYGEGYYEIFESPFGNKIVPDSLHRILEMNQAEGSRLYRTDAYGTPAFSGSMIQGTDDPPTMTELMESVIFYANEVIELEVRAKPSTKWQDIMENLGGVETELKNAFDLHYENDKEEDDDG